MSDISYLSHARYGKDKVRVLEGTVDNLTDENTKLADENGKLEGEVSELKEEAGALQTKVRTLEGEVSDLKDNVETLEAESDAARPRKKVKMKRRL